jgi:hypothetical protein
MTTNRTNEVATQAAGMPAVSDEDLALMQGQSHASDFTKDDMATPYLTIVQGTSPYVKRNEPEFIPDAREGDILDTLTLRLRTIAAFIPAKYEVHYTEWKPNRGAMVKQWGTDSSGYDAAEGDFGTRKTAGGNDITPSYVYFGLLIDDQTGGGLPVILSLTGTQAKKARRLNALINALELPAPGGGVFEPPIYARIYQLTTVPESNDLGSWSGWKIEPGPLTLTTPTGRSLFAKAKALRDQVDSGTVRAAAPTPAQRTATEGAADADIPF